MQQVLVRSYRAQSKSSQDSEEKALTSLEQDANRLYEQGYELRQLFGRPPAESTGLIASDIWVTLYAVYHLVDVQRAMTAPDGPGSTPAKGTGRFRVELLDAGSDHGGVSGVLMGLKDGAGFDNIGPLHASRIISGVPVTLTPDVSQDDAIAARRRLEAKGARVRISEVS
jgi:hypothetical protein